MSYDSSNLTTPDIKWLGVRPSDLDRFNIPQQCRLPMTDEDVKTGKRLVRHTYLNVSCAQARPSSRLWCIVAPYIASCSHSPPCHFGQVSPRIALTCGQRMCWEQQASAGR